jgi:hypothetical protein
MLDVAGVSITPLISPESHAAVPTLTSRQYNLREKRRKMQETSFKLALVSSNIQLEMTFPCLHRRFLEERYLLTYESNRHRVSPSSRSQSFA